MRLGSIEFINSLPVDLGISSGAVPLDAEIVQGSPAALNQKILSGELEVSPVSSFFYAQHHKDFLLLPGLSISSESGVQSVLLISRRPLRDLKGATIAISNQGRTTPTLLEILCRIRHGFMPRLVSTARASEMDILATRASASVPLAGADGVLLIGNEALETKDCLQKSGLHVTDLAAEWKHWTGLPIVFALWAVRRDAFAAGRDGIASIHDALLESKRWGLDHPEEVLIEAQKKVDLSCAALESYFSCLSYDFTPEMRKGFRLFLGYAVRCGLLEPVGAFEEIPGTGEAVLKA